MDGMFAAKNIFLITVFLTILLSSSNSSLKGTYILGSIDMFLLYDWPILQSAIKLIIFYFNSWLSSQQLCCLLWGLYKTD